MFKRADQGTGVLASTAALSLDQAVKGSSLSSRISAGADGLARIDWVPDLGADIGSLNWFRGLVTCTLLCSLALYIAPGIKPLYGAVPPAVEGKALQEVQTQTLQPLAWGGDTGRKMAPTLAVSRLTDSPERPTLSLIATIGQGDGFARVLERIGLSQHESLTVAQMVSSLVNPADIPAGTTMPIILGQRQSRDAARPLQSLDLRARFDMKLEIRRVGGELLMKKVPIAIDRTPLRIQGLVGDGLLRSAITAGAPPLAVEAYIKAIAPNISFDSDLRPDARFDIILENERSELGESRPGKLLYAGLQTNGRNFQLLEWTIDGRTDWYEASGVGQRRQGFVAPVSHARMSSGFGLRIHPVLGYTRFHRGVDYAAPTGTPVFAVTNGLVAYAGRNGGFGNQIRISHSGTLGTSYSHLSQIVVSPGARVSQGQLIGYVGTTGLSTGPHLHFEVYRNGAAVNPKSVTFETSSLLNGRALEAFHARRRALLAIPVTGAR